MTNLARIPVPSEGPITDKVKEIYECPSPPEEQIPLPELPTNTQLDEVSFLTRINPSLSAGENRADNVVTPTFSFVFPDLFYLGFLAVDRHTHSASCGPRILTHFRERYDDVPQLLEIEPVVREVRNYQQRVRHLAFYEHSGFTITNMLTHGTDQICRILAHNGIVSPRRPEEAFDLVTDDPMYTSRMMTD